MTPATTSSSMCYTLPTYIKALTIQKATVPHKPTYDAVLTKQPISPPKPGEVVVKLGAVGFNHKDVNFLKQEHRQKNHLFKYFTNRYGFVRVNTLESP